ncbi:TetR/AcrR family transcriptional regulator C-terminal domain-containing protein [Marinactinospora endophytica]
MEAKDGDGGPARRVAAELRRRIADGVLRPGDRVPSTRRIVNEFGVAMATASRVLALLREEGLIVTIPGSGSVVKAPQPDTPPVTPDRPRPLTRGRIVATAIALADREGADAISIRLLAGRLGVTPMTLSRHVAGRDELELLMIRAVFRSEPLSNVAPEGWREQLEEVCRSQWRLYRRHPWLAELLSVLRPAPVPEAMEHSERTLRALAQLGLTGTERWRAALALPALVRGLALTVVDELRTARETRMHTAEWWTAMEGEILQRFQTGRFPYLSAMEADEVIDDLDGLFELSLRCHLDGLAGLAGTRGRR